MRPENLAQYIGQQHLLAAGKPLPRAIEAGHLHSMILWGPPGTGKTTLAEVIARYASADVERISAVTSGVKGFAKLLSAPARIVMPDAVPSCLSMKCIALTKANRTPFYRISKMALSPLSARPRKIPLLS
ncbi:recombination factor protein RarA [Salmonella enterica subsp. enterica serovar Newport str. WA_14881]|nr:recombination factor protein RarA [Salmonella enterica subsp. enterica serovar Newport str. WA_14881]